MTEIADTPKQDLGESGVMEDSRATQKISVLDHINGMQYSSEKSDSFFIDMESLSNGGNKDINPNSRIKRSLSRKSPHRGMEKKIDYANNTSANDRDVATSLPRGPSMPEKVAVVAVGTADSSTNPQVHHHISIAVGNIYTTSTTEAKCPVRRNSFKRYQGSWLLDPRRVLLFFATLSSMGTLLLIYFTLSMAKHDVDNHNALE